VLWLLRQAFPVMTGDLRLGALRRHGVAGRLAAGQPLPGRRLVRPVAGAWLLAALPPPAAWRRSQEGPPPGLAARAVAL